MAGQFEDLVGDICGDHVIDITDGYAAAHDILGWLDDNPDLAPTRKPDLAEQDQIDAWLQVAKHPALEVCYRRMGSGKTFLRAVLDRLTELEEASPMTVTESQVQDAYDIISSRGSFASYREFLFGLGFRIMQDPKPTNAERIEEIIGKVGGFPGWERQLLAEGLDKAGVKAPEGSDGN